MNVKVWVLDFEFCMIGYGDFSAAFESGPRFYALVMGGSHECIVTG